MFFHPPPKRTPTIPLSAIRSCARRRQRARRSRADRVIMVTALQVNTMTFTYSMATVAALVSAAAEALLELVD